MARSDEDAGGLSIREIVDDLLLVLVRRRRLIIVVYGVVVLAAIARAFLIAPQYQASAKILFTADRASLSTSSDRTTELQRTNLVADGEIDTQLQIVRSRELVEGVLASLLKEYPPADVEKPSPGVVGRVFGAARASYRRLHGLKDIESSDPNYLFALDVIKRLRSSRLGNSNVIEIAYVDSNPVWARDLVARITQAYVERHSSLRMVESEDFFTQQSRLLQEKLATSEAALQTLRREVGAQAGQKDEISRQLNEFSAELARTKISREEQERRVGYLRHLKGGAAQAPERARVATPELLALEARRVELLGRYRPGSEKVRDIDEQIRRLRTAISTYDTIDGNAENAETDVVAAQASLAALRGREEALTREREDYREQAVRLEAQNADLVRLERQARLDEEAYLSYVRTAEQSRLSNAIEQSKLLRLTIIEPAQIPMEPVAPDKRRIVVFALLGGLAIAVGAGWARDRFDSTLKTAAEVRRYAGLDVLAILPDRG